MYLSKRSNGKYYIYFKQPNGKNTCISTRTKSKVEALQFLTEFQRIMQEKERLKILPIRLKDFFDEFLRYSEAIHSPKHTETLKATFNIAKRYFGEVLLTDLTRQQLQRFAEDRLKKVSVHSVKRDKANLSTSFTYAIDNGYLTGNPAKEIRLPRLPERQPLFFSESEFEQLLESVEEPDLKDLIIFALHTGLRMGEILSLQWSQINFKEMFLILDNRYSLTKSKRVRAVPLSIKAAEILTDRELKKSGDLVFTLNGKQISPDSLSWRFKQYVIKSGINPDLSFHSLRHTFASWLVQRGVPILQVSKLLGHSDVRTSQIYSHLTTDNLRTSIEVLNNNK